MPPEEKNSTPWQERYESRGPSEAIARVSNSWEMTAGRTSKCASGRVAGMCSFYNHISDHYLVGRYLISFSIDLLCDEFHYMRINGSSKRLLQWLWCRHTRVLIPLSYPQFYDSFAVESIALLFRLLMSCSVVSRYSFSDVALQVPHTYTRWTRF